ncbi:MAG: hypothetical protein COY81_00705 [Candidatus Pacebacteria bacterium CG_4_10_14_0_8_um_filter_43_12]|nr:MAG: hypothetical protein COU66_03700 [Candidatus Pacebacteria bacterium CG10_big_fil_rev_8_21_14_0_10_44_11]PIY79801.1 MAG: hypothetical protein COY81_00705 [Candidatus Pacebacteria bacterium CG_4_10_14_0_8_um_filter_43_12]
MKPNLDLDIIILTFNSEFWLKKTLATLQDLYLSKTKRAVQVTVVDNNSEDDTLQTLQTEFAWVKRIELHKNVGFAAANNVALQRSTAQYVMLLNSDIECTPQSNFDQLLTYLDNHPQVGIISPKVVFKNGAIDPACHRGEPTPWASFTYFFGLEQLFPHLKHFSQYHQWYKIIDTIHQIDACSGAAMIIRSKLMNEIGWLDEQFFMYAEDLDWCKRSREAGHPIIFYPFVSVIHHKYKSGIRGTSIQIARKTRRHFYDTMLQYYDKHYRQKHPEVLRMILKYFIIIKKGAT